MTIAIGTSKTSGTMTTLKKLFFVSVSSILPLFSVSAQAGPYCLALRGNGESEPAHWGALANLVEKKGLPIAQAGGSSATISLFLLESIARNPLVSQASAKEQNDRAALLIKSIYGVSVYLAQTPQSQAGLGVYKAIKSENVSALGSALKQLSGTGTSGPINIFQLKDLAIKLNEFGIADSPRYANLIKIMMKSPRDISPLDLKKISFYSGEIKRAFAAMGAFDAEGDSDLLFRDGVINFRKLGLGVGRVATFLSGKNWNASVEGTMRTLIQTCSSVQQGKTWQEIVQLDPRCQELVSVAAHEFFSQKIDWSTENIALGSIGEVIPTYPTTAILTGEAFKTAKNAYSQYHEKMDRSFSKNFRIKNVDDVRLGYWGDLSGLAKIKSNLEKPFTDSRGRSFDFSSDAKSKKFLGLGPAKWVEVLSLSPAEPGLASIQPVKLNGEDAFSAGGWSDLHPVPVLKALGCGEVIYVTRKGGESLFGQGVAKRVLNLDRSWEVLRTSSPEATRKNSELNNLGDKEDMTSLWSRLYNVANPKSSYMVSLASADGVLCTDWNRFDVKSGLEEIVTESYKAPYLLRRDRSDLQAELNHLGASIILNQYELSDDGKSWVGCRPPAGI